MKKIKLQTLYSKKADNNVLEWNIQILEDHNRGIIIIQYGQKGGKIIETKRVITKGKNIGKKNETTSYQQAILEAKSLWNSKKDRNGYTPFLNQKGCPKKNNDLRKVRPMLAQRYDERKKYIKYPCFVQPKLDGIRCLAYLENNKIYLLSRKGKIFPHLDHIKKELYNLKFDGFLDGELFTTKIEFQDISGLVRKEKLDNADIQKSEKIEYHIYDTFNLDTLDIPYNKRYQQLNKLLNKNGKSIIKVKTYLVKTEKEMFNKYKQFLKQKYEGIIIRNYEGIYKVKYRSNDLIKLKPFQDKEYKIIGYAQGKGREKGCVIWICQNSNGKQFSVRPKGSLEERKQLYKDGKKYIGKMLTIRYQNILEGIPRFGIGIGIRNYE